MLKLTESMVMLTQKFFSSSLLSIAWDPRYAPFTTSTVRPKRLKHHNKTLIEDIIDY